jgi:hypothetical protein
MTKEQEKYLLSIAFLEVLNAVAELIKPTRPQTPWPRPPKPVILGPNIVLNLARHKASHISYTLELHNRENYVNALFGIDGPLTSISQSAQDMAQLVTSKTDRPRDLVRVLRQIRGLAAWARKRAEGRRRAAEEILRQQRKWVDILESEMAICKLAS